MSGSHETSEVYPSCGCLIRESDVKEGRKELLKVQKLMERSLVNNSHSQKKRKKERKK
jgi:Tfp pilus assembly protein PilE